MSFDSDLRLMVPRPVRRFPADLAATVGFVVLTCGVVLLPGLDGNPLRIVLGLPFVLFLPGYALVSALFPEALDDEATGESRATDAAQRTGLLPRPGDRIDGVERAVLSVGTSVAIVPLIGLLLNFTPSGLRPLPVSLSVGGFTLIATAIAVHRRWELPPDERFAVPYRRWLGTARAELFDPESRTDAALNVALVLSLLLAVGSVSYAIAVPKQGDRFTEFYLLTENETGSQVADDYPTEFTRGESKPLYVGIENHERRPTNYTVVAVLQRVETANDTTRVIESRELRRFHPSVGANETRRVEHEVTPNMSGERLRLRYLLYKGNAPPTPTAADAYRDLHLWVNVTDSGR